MYQNGVNDGILGIVINRFLGHNYCRKSGKRDE